MKTLLVLALLAAGLVLALAPASAQTVPSVRGLRAFSPQTNFMSLEGYLRWQYFVENNAWISRAEAESLAKAQQ
jgi:hypothetical protein